MPNTIPVPEGADRSRPSLETTKGEAAKNGPREYWTRHALERLAAGDARDDVAIDFDVSMEDLEAAIKDAAMEWIDSTFREAICLLQNAAYAELDGVMPEINY